MQAAIVTIAGPVLLGFILLTPSLPAVVALIVLGSAYLVS
jgi:hypothetical protein